MAIHVVTHDRTYDPRVARDEKALAEDGADNASEVDNAYEPEKNSVRIRRGVASAARRGEPPGGPVPLGYQAMYSPRTGERTGWEIVPAKAAVVREIVQRVGSHEPVRAILRDLTARGIAPPNGREWTDQGIKNIARNPVYAGLRRVPDSTELVTGVWPAIVDATAWRHAAAVLTSRQTGQRPGGVRHLLTNIATCRECRTGLRVMKVYGNLSYSCRKGCIYLPYEWLDTLVGDVICERLSRGDARDLFLRDDSRSAALREELASLRQRHKQFCVAAARGKITPDALAEVEAALLPDIERAEAELDALLVPPALFGIASSGDVRTAWKGYGVQARRAIITALTGIEIARAQRDRSVPAASRDRVTFTWKPEPRRGPGRPRRDWFGTPASIPA